MKFFEFLALYDYCEALLVFTILVAFIFSLRHHGRHRAFRIIPYYFGSWLLMEGVQFYWYISPRSDRFANLLNLTTALFIVFEFCVFSLLILPYIEGAGRRLAIKLNMAIFFMAEIFLYFRAFPRNQIVPMSMVAAAALVPPCAIYFYELFTNLNTKALKDRPSFWIVTGITCQTAYNASLLVSMEYTGRFGNGAYDFAILFYCILFVLFMRAYKCSPAEWVTASGRRRQQRQHQPRSIDMR